MDHYPREYVERDLPLVVLSGLGERYDESDKAVSHAHTGSGTRLLANASPCSEDRAAPLLHQFLQLDGTGLPSNTSAFSGPPGSLKCRIKAVGRAYTLPSRKAAPLPQSPSSEGFPPHHANGARTELHSPLSPLSPGSPIFPDGMFTPLWFAKHQQQVPCLFLAFFDISASDSAEQDERLKNDINSIRTALTRSGFKTRFATVLLSDTSILKAPQLEERLSSIRRLTSLDSKTGLFFMPPMSAPGEIATFVHSIMTPLQPLCMEYYRDLTKHARRKKTKGPSPMPALALIAGAGAQSLSMSGWNVRYEIKQGAFAEMRQEMDVAERHYTSAIEELFGSGGTFETTPSSSPRWEEARALSDGLAIRVLRCQLWTTQTTASVRYWSSYKRRTKELIERQDNGLQTFAWDAWASRWAEIMAQLVQRAALPTLEWSTSRAQEASTGTATQQIYAPTEKAFAGIDRLVPFQFLHHAGYWLRVAVQGCQVRQKRAAALLTESEATADHSSTSNAVDGSSGQTQSLGGRSRKEMTLSKTSSILSGDDRSHFSTLSALAQGSIKQYSHRNQARLSDFMKLELAHDLISIARYQDAFQIVQPLWEGASWRQEDWYDIFADLLMALRYCAQYLKIHKVIVATTYELSSISSFIPKGVSIDLDGCLTNDHLHGAAGEDRVELSFTNHQRLCPVILSFAFCTQEIHVGEALDCQLTVESAKHALPAPLTLSSLAVSIGSAKTITITHRASGDDQPAELVDFSNSSGGEKDAITVESNLTICSGQKRIFGFRLVFREASMHQLRQTSISIRNDRFNIEHTFTEEPWLRVGSIFVANKDGPVEKALLPHNDTTAVTVLPKPPKVRMLVLGSSNEYYTDEVVRLGFDLLNGEVEAIEGRISVRLSPDVEDTLPLRWIDEKGTEINEEELHDPRRAPVVHAIPQVATSATHRIALHATTPPYPVQAEVFIDLEYTLVSDSATTLRKTLAIGLNVVHPFEAKFSFGPLLYRNAWPSYFDPQSGISSEQSSGIPQLWRLGSHIQALSANELCLHDVKLTIDNVVGHSHASVRASTSAGITSINPGQTELSTFEISTQKHALDDRHPTTVEATLAITWSREEDTDRFTTSIAVPHLNLPASEPRVLCTITNSGPDDDYDAILQYHIENPSAHFLTFALTMEATEEFAFSGPKYRTLSLAPFTRYKVDYRIVLSEDEDLSSSSPGSAAQNGRWIWPSLQVIDSYYQKTLRVHPGGDGVRFDEKQNIGVFVGTT